MCNMLEIPANILRNVGSVLGIRAWINVVQCINHMGALSLYHTDTQSLVTFEKTLFALDFTFIYFLYMYQMINELKHSKKHT